MVLQLLLLHANAHHCQQPSRKHLGLQQCDFYRTDDMPVIQTIA